MCVTAGRLDVDRGARSLGQARQHVTGHSRIVLERQLGVRAPAQIDCRPRQRVVHRHDCVAVAGDPAAVAERLVEGFADGERGVLGGVMLAGLEVAGPFDDEVEACVKGQLLEEMIVEACPRRDADSARAVECESYGEPCLCGRPQSSCAPATSWRDGRRAFEHARERLDERVVVLTVEH
jgi:hypothetical protein